VLTAYLAAVDGNGGNGTSALPYDVLGDDVFVGAVPMLEAGADAPGDRVGGCAAAGGRAGPLALLVIAAGLLAVRRRRWRIGAYLLALVLAMPLLGGCKTVRPWDRGTLAKRKMTFAPDATEDELDLHMQESREGSSGGYGSAGGGCGCN
jgi:hypothetical protein